MIGWFFFVDVVRHADKGLCTVLAGPHGRRLNLESRDARAPHVVRAFVRSAANSLLSATVCGANREANIRVPLGMYQSCLGIDKIQVRRFGGFMLSQMGVVGYYNLLNYVYSR